LSDRKVWLFAETHVQPSAGHAEAIRLLPDYAYAYRGQRSLTRNIRTGSFLKPVEIGPKQRERPGALKDLERIKWYLWHGNVFQALNELQSLEMDLDAAVFESKDENARKLLKGVEDLHAYVERNREFVPNYGERYRNGEKIASGFVESAINQVVRRVNASRWIIEAVQLAQFLSLCCISVAFFLLRSQAAPAQEIL
jgi:hypothetical protein